MKTPCEDRPPESKTAGRAGVTARAGRGLLATVLVMAAGTARGDEGGPAFQSKFLALGLSAEAPAFRVFAVDSLGQGKLARNPVLPGPTRIAGLELTGQSYRLKGKEVWRVTWTDRSLVLMSDYAAGVEAPPFVLAFHHRLNHATLLGRMAPGGKQMSLPCVLHLPDMGSLRVTGAGALDYSASRSAQPPFVRIAFPPATAEHPHCEYRLEVTAFYPRLAGIDEDPRYDGFRRDWLNMFQVNPRLQVLANNSASDPCAFTLYEYAELAAHTPPLADGLTANDLVRMTLDRYLSGMKAYGQAGYWPTPWTSLDSLPSLLIAAATYVNSSGDMPWAAAHFEQLSAWGHEMFASDHDGNGLIEYPGSGNFGDRPQPTRRPANWWDTINFGHEDAFANALAYRAAMLCADLARHLDQPADAEFFATRAAKLRSAYAPTFLNPKTGVLAGWKSADGQLHDYWFTFVQGMAITFGLLDEATANRIMDRLLAKLNEVGYTDFSLGLPGNLVPVPKGDYVVGNGTPEEVGEPLKDDGSDGFQYYENGGATGCWAYYTIKALYQLGRVDDARRILHPMLGGYARGGFQGFDSNGRSFDWRDWKGHGHGYEGLLVDNYHALLAVLDDRRMTNGEWRMANGEWRMANGE